MKRRPSVSLIFINYNSTDFLERALLSLEQAEPELDKEIIVVDNCSYDRESVKRLCGRFFCRLVLLNKNRGYGAAANRGFLHARGDFITVVNPDVEFTPQALSRLVAFMNENDDVGVVAPQLLYPDRTPQPSSRRLPKLRYILAGRRSPLVRLFPRYAPAQEFLYTDVWQQTAPVEVEAVIGTLMVFRRTAFVSVGGFDENYFMFAEDLDICQRLREQGWKVYLEPGVKIVHYYGGVRRRWRRFTEFHRIKALYRFFIRGKSRMIKIFYAVAFAGYFFIIEGGGLVGLGEYEYSWRLRAKR
ncbi:MAG: glycosyltransferase family 2 protein [candidate division WOR-3 bacterium]|nr:glycosyltransferase family 2 protein [candidate division WOR-3 bacterium]MDH7518451.1 glycosyltransferase family 2 protein [bacterium]